MKYLIVLVVALSACGETSSPEGRLNLKLEGVQKKLDSLGGSADLKKEIDSLKIRNAAMFDSIHKISQRLKELEGE